MSYQVISGFSICTCATDFHQDVCHGQMLHVVLMCIIHFLSRCLGPRQPRDFWYRRCTTTSRHVPRSEVSEGLPARRDRILNQNSRAILILDQCDGYTNGLYLQRRVSGNGVIENLTTHSLAHRRGRQRQTCRKAPAPVSLPVWRGKAPLSSRSRYPPHWHWQMHPSDARPLACATPRQLGAWRSLCRGCTLRQRLSRAPP